MTEALHPDHQDLLQFLYQFPIGVIEMNDAGDVEMMNPAASRLLITELEAGESVATPLPMLRRLAPDLFDKLDSNPEQIGMISTGRGHEVDSRDGATRFTVSVHRARPDRIIVSLTDVTEERRIVNDQRARAQRLQRALLGRIDLTDLDVSVAYLPANSDDLSGGDWYDVIAIDDERVALVVGDVVGHDIEASATMGQLRTIVRAFALVDPDPVSVLERTENLARAIEGALAATVHYALLDRRTSSVDYASAGHPPPVIMRSNGEIEFLRNGRRAVLAAVGKQSKPSAVTQLEPGDILVVYTDGLIERRGESLDEGLDRLRERAGALDRTETSVDELVERLSTAMLHDTNHHDDVCILAIRHQGAVEAGVDG